MSVASAMIALLTFFIAGVLVAAVRRSGIRQGEPIATCHRWTIVTAVGMALWLALTAGLGASGLFEGFRGAPPYFVRFLGLTGLMTIAVAASPFGRRLVTGLPLWGLIGFQSFRVLVEAALAIAYHEGIVPRQMTFEGLNFDIVSGLSAVGVAWLASQRRASRGVVLGWNLLGLALLAAIVVIANLSAPTSYRLFHDGPSSAIVTTTPFIWLPTVLVQAALFGHILVFRWLALSRRHAA